MNNGIIEKLLLSRQKLIEELHIPYPTYKGEEEGGCGVVGFCATEPVAARHIHEPSKQMHNRGNGKGGGIAALGFIPEQLGVTREVLDNYYMVHIAFLDNDIRPELETEIYYSLFRDQDFLPDGYRGRLDVDSFSGSQATGCYALFRSR